MTGRDPYGLERELLDDTPWYIPGADNRRGTERSLGFCNPYGYEDDRVTVFGGTRSPAHEPYLWQCRNYAQGRYRMVCVNGHSGLVLLCYGHVWMIQHHHSRAKNGACPRCVWPARARELDERCTSLMRQIADPQAWPDDRQRWASGLEDARRELTEMVERGLITNGAPLRLEEVS
jgi:hypothetical protein